jgi:hypothetical protein
MLQIVFGASEFTVLDDDGACAAVYCKSGGEIARVQLPDSTRAAGDLCGAAKQ